MRWEAAPWRRVFERLRHNRRTGELCPTQSQMDRPGLAGIPAGNLTRAFRDVLLTLHSYRGTGGVAWPSQATLAERAHTCVRTVQRALDQARVLDLLHSCERRVRAGWRWLRTLQCLPLYDATDAGSAGPAGTALPCRAATTRHPVCEENRRKISRRDATGGCSGSDLLLASRIAMAQWQTIGTTGGRFMVVAE